MANKGQRIVRILVCAILGSFQLPTHSLLAQGDPNAKQVGTFFLNLRGEPTTLNPLTSTDLYSQGVHAYVLEPLLSMDPDTYEWKPGLAESWKNDGKVFTFVLRKGAKWHDGKPLTAEDVKFSFDVMFDDKYKSAHKRVYFELIEKCEIVDASTIRFVAKEMYFKNFEVVAASFLSIVPKHLYKDPNAKNLNKTLVGSGPYKLVSYEPGKRIVLEKFSDWWGKDEAKARGEYNFQKIVMRFAKESTLAMEMLKKGDIDYYEFSPEDFAQRAQGPEWGKKLMKVKVENKMPKQYGFIGWNNSHPIFGKREARIAMGHLMNRRLMNEKFRFGLSQLAAGPWHYKSDYASKNVKPIEYDPQKALELLKKIGWEDSSKEGKLSRTIDGKKTYFEFTLMTANEGNLKYYTMFKEDARQVGVQVDIKLVEWSTLMKLVEERKFDAIVMGWNAGSVDVDPKQIWHSSSSVKGGSNFIGYSNTKVDELIDKGRKIMDRNQRIPIFQQVYELIAADAPYTFLFNDVYELYGHTARIRKPKDTFQFVIGSTYWWVEK